MIMTNLYIYNIFFIWNVFRWQIFASCLCICSAWINSEIEMNDKTILFFSLCNQSYSPRHGFFSLTTNVLRLLLRLQNECNFFSGLTHLFDNENDNNFRCICVTCLFVSSSSSSLIWIGDQRSSTCVYTGVHLYIYIYKISICEKMKQVLWFRWEREKKWKYVKCCMRIISATNSIKKSTFSLWLFVATRPNHLLIYRTKNYLKETNN